MYIVTRPNFCPGTKSFLFGCGVQVMDVGCGTLLSKKVSKRDRLEILDSFRDSSRDVSMGCGAQINKVGCRIFAAANASFQAPRCIATIITLRETSEERIESIRSFIAARQSYQSQVNDPSEEMLR